MKRYHWLICLSLIFLAFGCASVPEPPAKQHLTILYFGDLEGHLAAHPTADGRTLGGVARLASLIEQVRSQNDRRNVPTLLFYTGGCLSGSPINEKFRGKATVRILNQLEIAGTVVAPADLRYGRKYFDELVKEAKFPWIVSNLRGKRNANPWLPLGFARILPNGLIFGVVGVTSPAVLTHCSESEAYNLAVDTETLPTKVAAARTGSRDGVNVILSQCGPECDEQLAVDIPGTDVIIAPGESMTKTELTGGITRVTSGVRGEHLGRLDIEGFGRTILILRHKIYDITPDLPEDRITKSLENGYLNRLKNN
ncbi:MAG: hypothetical protein P9L99_19365 [Candidatus Lernaella stagnicola]|nr:hypothetical protein [Candidatus Lernaella stagnicola]